ncbi:DUF2357 domain-containing protein [Weissella paramesenteroides]|jgi:hypothetical protein|uniref:DUF2357 domain-containing protein n=1 Tax=Weissella paramesenteroides TaxID=1249 RepID=UPI003F1FB630
MDLQSKLILLNNDEDFELDLHIDDDLENLNERDLIYVKEFSELDILLESSEDDFFELPEMDDYYIPNRKESESNNHYKYPANINFSLFNFKNSENAQVVPLVPGLYTVVSHISGKKFYSYFLVNPKDLTKMAWKEMKDEIEGTISGLAVDFYHRKSSELITETKGGNSSSVTVNKINLLLQREKQLRFAIERLRREARYKIGKAHQWKPTGAKNLIDSITIRKVGERPDKKGMVFSTRRYLDYNVPENRWVKMILKNFIIFGNQSIVKLKKIKSGLVKKRLDNEQYDTRRNISDVFFQKKRLETNLKSISIDIDRLNKLVSYLHKVLNDEFLSMDVGSLNKDVPKVLVLNPKYNFIYKLYIDLNKKQDQVNLDHSYDYFWKRTDDLYEIWTFIKTIQALIEIGYQPQSGWIFSKNPFEDILPKLSPEDFVIFKNKKGNTIRLVFNSIIRRGGKSVMENPLLTDSNRNRPDIRMDLFDKNNDYAGSILLDAKYKRLAQVMKQHYGEKGLMEQFREYKKAPYVSKGFWHVDELLQSQLMPVQAVIVLYPNNDGSNIRKKSVEQHILTIELNPSLGMSEYVAELNDQISQRYQIFKRYKSIT